MVLFGTTEETAEITRVLAFNQGCYNLGAAALLLWFYGQGNIPGVQAVLVFLFCMGVVGALTANWRILVVQSLPAMAAFLGLTL